jgi:hypothetical protein
MKILLLAAANTSFLHLKGPDGTPLFDGKNKVGIDLFGPGSEESARLEERVSARVVKRMAENDNKVGHVPVDQRRAETAQDLTDMTAAFHHIEHEGADGKPLSGTALYHAVYSDPKLGWIKEQVLKHLGDWGKFTTGSATS